MVNFSRTEYHKHVVSCSANDKGAHYLWSIAQPKRGVFCRNWTKSKTECGDKIDDNTVLVRIKISTENKTEARSKITDKYLYFSRFILFSHFNIPLIGELVRANLFVKVFFFKVPSFEINCTHELRDRSILTLHRMARTLAGFPWRVMSNVPLGAWGVKKTFSKDHA